MRDNISTINVYFYLVNLVDKYIYANVVESTVSTSFIMQKKHNSNALEWLVFARTGKKKCRKDAIESMVKL